MQNSNWIDGCVSGKAFKVVCVWLRSRLDVLFQRLVTLSDILDVVLMDIPTAHYNDIIIQGDPGLHCFIRLANKDHQPFDFLCCLFPEMDCVEVCTGIVEKYLGLSSKCVYFIPPRRA